MATRNPAGKRATKRRYLEQQKIAKYGTLAAGRDMRGRHGNHARGTTNGRWNSGRLITSQGYVAVRVPKDHPHAWGPTHGHHRYAYEHDLIAEDKLGRPLRAGETIHHVDGDRQNNAWANLAVETRSDHAREHGAARELGTTVGGSRLAEDASDRKGGDPDEWPRTSGEIRQTGQAGSAGTQHIRDQCVDTRRPPPSGKRQGRPRVAVNLMPRGQRGSLPEA